jgi:hypothetical protein
MGPLERVNPMGHLKMHEVQKTINTDLNETISTLKVNAVYSSITLVWTDKI